MHSAEVVQSAAAVNVAAAKRILICSAGIPHERDGASVVLFYHYIDRLRREGYCIRHILLLPGEGWSDSAVADYTGKMTDPADPARFTVTAIRAPRFYTESRRQHRLVPAAAEQVETAAGTFEPALIVAFDLLAAWITARLDAPHRVVWLGDLNFQTMFYHAWYAARENPVKSLHILSNWLGARAWKRIYREALKDADEVVVASASSVDQLARIGIRATYEPYPWPESTADRTISDTAPLPAMPTFVFFGSLGGLGSRSALHFITRKVFPLLRRQWGVGGFRILVAGRGEIPDWSRRAFEGKPEIERLGFVEDLDTLLAGCHAVLVPIDVPVGNRSRILTAMAKRVLVIAHANAALGNPDLVDGVTCYLATNARDFVDGMRRAVEERRSVEAIIERAYRRYDDHFSVAAAGGRLAGRVARLIGSPQPGRTAAASVS